MNGKSTRQDNPWSARRATRKLWKVNIDLIGSSKTSVEGYNYAAIFVDWILMVIWTEDKGCGERCGTTMDDGDS
jgi:hypothetical protein